MNSNGDETYTEQMLDVLRRIEAYLAALNDVQPPTPREWLTVSEVAKELRVSRDTIERLIGSGQLRATCVRTSNGRGRRNRYRIHRDWLNEYLLNQSTRAQRDSKHEPPPYDGPDFFD